VAKKMIIKGVGSFMAKRYAADGKGVEVITLGSLQDLKIDLSVELDDIFGGDGLFAIDQLVKSKAIEISATDAKFDLDALQLMMGSTVQNQVADQSIWVLGEQGALVADTIPGGGTPVNVAKTDVDFGGTLFGDGNFQLRLKDNNLLLKKVAYSATVTPAADEFAVEVIAGSPTTAKIVLHEDNVGKDVVYNYQRKEVVDVVDILANEVPFPVHVVHHGSFVQKDGSYAGIETELYQCIAHGNFNIDAARSTASTSAVSLRVLDPERTDGKIGSIKRFSSQKKI
jgi:hypothetical protein